MWTPVQHSIHSNAAVHFNKRRTGLAEGNVSGIQSTLSSQYIMHIGLVRVLKALPSTLQVLLVQGTIYTANQKYVHKAPSLFFFLFVLWQTFRMLPPHSWQWLTHGQRTLCFSPGLDNAKERVRVTELSCWTAAGWVSTISTSFPFQQCLGPHLWSSRKFMESQSFPCFGSAHPFRNHVALVQQCNQQQYSCGGSPRWHYMSCNSSLDTPSDKQTFVWAFPS